MNYQTKNKICSRLNAMFVSRIERRIFKDYKWYFAFCCMLISNIGWSLPTDREQPTQFSSDSQTVNLKDGLVTWLGNAVFIQGSLKIQADKIVVNLDKEQKPTHMIATGSPALFQQQPEADKSVIHGEALTIVYDVKTNLVSLEKDAQVEQDGATTRGAQFDYDINSSNLKASGGVTTVIPPKQTAPATTPAPKK